MIAFIVLLVILIVIDAATWVISGRGTMTNAKARRKIPLLLYLRLFFTIPEIALNILGTYWSFDDSRHCPDEAIVIVKVAVITNWCLLAFAIIFTYCVFDPLGSVKQDGNLGKYTALGL